MTLGEALLLIQQRAAAARRKTVFLACGFEPLHLATFLQGHLAERFPGHRPEVLTGVYGDLEGALAASRESSAGRGGGDRVGSLDPRLGLRSAGGWSQSVHADITDTCRQRFTTILKSLAEVAARMPVAVVPPALPIELVGHTPLRQASRIELELDKQASEFLFEAGRIRGASILSSTHLERLSPPGSRRDALMELKAGFPYTLAHASAVAGEMVKLLFPPAPMKGLITDLDGTLWAGIVGEVGIEGAGWSLEKGAQIHGLYQQMLRHLSEMGVLLACASKNELAVAEAALRRDDLLIAPGMLFPVCASWGPKSESVAEILRVWNIGADSVVFVDDSRMELEEVKAAFPAMTCLQFPNKQPAKTIELLTQLRDLFGKRELTSEDALRAASIRANVPVEEGMKHGDVDSFVRALDGRVSFDPGPHQGNGRLLELINKTNQFNLNGARLSEGEWLQRLSSHGTRVIGVAYQDKFGPLGTIGVMAGFETEEAFELENWVLSCRAFSRRIEDHMLDFLFQQCGARAIRFRFRATERNQPLQKYLESLALPVDGDAPLTLAREEFESHRAQLPHQTRTTQ